jgi:hypothetical protein
MAVWVVYFMSLEIKQIWTTIRKESCIAVFSNYIGFWNLLDIARILSLLAYIIVYNREDIREEEKQMITTFLILSSWLCALDTLRLFEQFQFILTLIKTSINDMFYFFVVLMIINQGLFFAYKTTLDRCWSYPGAVGCENFDFTDDYFYNRESWIMLFGNFGMFVLDTPIQVAIFILWTFLIPLLLMSLLISFVSDTYTRVYEKRQIATFTEMAELIHDLEMLLPPCRCSKAETKQYLSFAQEVPSENMDQDISVGIGQKVSMMG